MISIRRYLYGRTQAVETSPPDSAGGDAMPLVNLVAALLGEVETQLRGESHARFEPLAAAMHNLRERLEPAGQETDLEAVGEEAVRLMTEYRDVRAQVERQQSREVQNMVAMLHRTIEVLSGGNQKSVSRLRRIEAEIRSAAQLNEILALRERLGACMEQIQKERIAEREEFIQARAQLEHDIHNMQEHMALARCGIPGRGPAEQQMEQSGSRSVWVVTVLDRLSSIKARYGGGVAEKYFWAVTGEFSGRLPAPKRLFRWNDQSLLVELPTGGAVEPLEREIRIQISSMPRDLRVDVGQRMAVFEISYRWCLAGLAPEEPAEALVRRVEQFVNR